MTDQSRDTNNGPLFQEMDEQERTYAPQQVPGNDVPAPEVDQGGTAGAASPTGATDGDTVIVPGVPVYPTAGSGIQPAMPAVPVTDDESRNDTDTNRDQQ